MNVETIEGEVADCVDAVENYGAQEAAQNAVLAALGQSSKAVESCSDLMVNEAMEGAEISVMESVGEGVVGA